MKGAEMKVLVAGATGAIGTQLVPRLVAAGHDVVGTTRSETRAETVQRLGATPAVLDALDPAPPEAMRSILDAIRYVERVVTSADWTEGVVLRYGGFYGPGTSLAGDGELTEMIRKRRFPVVGDGGGVWSFIHI